MGTNDRKIEVVRGGTNDPIYKYINLSSPPILVFAGGGVVRQLTHDDILPQYENIFGYSYLQFNDLMR